MKRFWLLFACCLFASDSVYAQSSEMTPELAQKIINTEFLPPQAAENTKTLKQSVDYVAENDSEASLRKIILYREEAERKIADKLNKKYVPYDRRIDVKKPEQVKRYFRSRLDAIY